MIKDMPVLDVYVAQIPLDIEVTELYPPSRSIEIEACKNQDVKLEKYCVWRLLELAVGKTLTRDFNSFSFSKDKHGKWQCEDFFFSLSHSSGLVAVAVSQSPVGVDIEALNRIKGDRLSGKILSEEELYAYKKLSDDQKALYLLEMWTKKEASFKRSGGAGFIPSRVDTAETKALTLEYDGRIFMLSVSSNNLESLRLLEVDDLTKL